MLKRENVVENIRDKITISGGNAQRTWNPALGKPLPGRIYAAPTNLPGITGKRGRQMSAVDPPACERGRDFRKGARMSLAGCKESFA